MARLKSKKKVKKKAQKKPEKFTILGTRRALSLFELALPNIVIHLVVVVRNIQVFTAICAHVFDLSWIVLLAASYTSKINDETQSCYAKRIQSTGLSGVISILHARQ
jgi:hypothetical protein